MRVDPAAVGADAIAGAPEQAVERQADALGEDVPQRDVDRGEGIAGQTARAERMEFPPAPAPDALHVPGILAEDEGGEVGVHELPDRAAAKTPRVGEAGARQPRISGERGDDPLPVGNPLDGILDSDGRGDPVEPNGKIRHAHRQRSLSSGAEGPE
jgi:hypothetical protein